jgi:hypothetical protein
LITETGHKIRGPVAELLLICGDCCGRKYQHYGLGFEKGICGNGMERAASYHSPPETSSLVKDIGSIFFSSGEGSFLGLIIPHVHLNID